MIKKNLNFYGIKFYNSNYSGVIKLLNKKGGYLVIPAASSLVNIKKDKLYKQALQKSSIAIFDSGFFCFCLLLLKFYHPKKFSGFKFIYYFLRDKDNNFKKKKILLIEPNIQSAKINKIFMKKNGFRYIFNYIAPIYKNDFVDKKLLKLIKYKKPEIIITSIAGGKQEKLAFVINQYVSKKTLIFCTGAAISFFSGLQAPITRLIDILYLGWLMRLIFNPKSFFPRIVRSFSLFFLVLKYKCRFF